MDGSAVRPGLGARWVVPRGRLGLLGLVGWLVHAGFPAFVTQALTGTHRPKLQNTGTHLLLSSAKFCTGSKLRPHIYTYLGVR